MLNPTHWCRAGAGWLTLIRYDAPYSRTMAQIVLGCLKCQGLHLIPGRTSWIPAQPSITSLCHPAHQSRNGIPQAASDRGEEGRENPLPSPLPCFSPCLSAGLPSWSVTWGWAPPPCEPPAPRWQISAGSGGGCSCPARRWRSWSVWRGLQWPSSAHWAHFSASCSPTPALASGKQWAIKQFR